MALPRSKFDGKLNNKTIYDFKKQLDYNLSQKKRIQLVKNILYTQNGMIQEHLDPYFEEFFEQNNQGGIDISHFKVGLNKKDNLSENNNVCNELEKMANYILFSPDGQRITKKTKYNFYPEHKLKEKMDKEESLDKLLEDKYDDDEYDNLNTTVFDEIINYLVVPAKNYKKEIKQTIYDKDLNDPELKSIKNYQDFIDIL
jgi:hypothetical protein